VIPPVLRAAARRAAVLAGAAVLLASPSSGQEWREYRAARQGHGVETLRVEVKYGAGRLAVGGSDSGLLYDVTLHYDAERFEPIRSWNAPGGAGNLVVELNSVGGHGDGAINIDLDDLDLDLDLSDLSEIANSSGRLELALGHSTPTDLSLHVGAAKSTLELGGIPLSSVEMKTGASETHLTFDVPNPVEMTHMSLEIGAADFEARGLGNAHFERLDFKGGVGTILLDFGGEWRRDAVATLAMGLAKLRIRIPADLGVRIRRKSFLISFDAPGFEKNDDVWLTPNWDSAEYQLDIDLETAFGTIRIERIP